MMHHSRRPPRVGTGRSGTGSNSRARHKSAPIQRICVDQGQRSRAEGSVRHGAVSDEPRRPNHASLSLKGGWGRGWRGLGQGRLGALLQFQREGDWCRRKNRIISAEASGPCESV
jgi:hypothetical protein